jgi:hypothetical protein
MASADKSLPAEAAREAGVERRRADVAQLAERVLGKDEVTSSILVIGSILCQTPTAFTASDGQPTSAATRGRSSDRATEWVHRRASGDGDEQ